MFMYNVSVLMPYYHLDNNGVVEEEVLREYKNCEYKLLDNNVLRIIPNDDNDVYIHDYTSYCVEEL